MSNKFLKGVDLGSDKGHFIPNLTGVGAPSEVTEGAVGLQYMDTQTGRIYVCTAVSNGTYIWEALKGEDELAKKAVLYTEQTLTNEQQAQARENIGAGTASIDDTKVGADAWSGKNIIDRMCPSFTESGSIVTCQPVEGYPLSVVTEIAPIGTGLNMAGNHVANIDSLLPQARIAVEGAQGKVISNPSDNAANVAQCFTAGEGLEVVVGDTGALTIAAASENSGNLENQQPPETPKNPIFTTEFNPANNDGYGYCEACYKQALAAGKTEQEALEAAWKHWEVYDKNALGINSDGAVTSAKSGAHYYLNASLDLTDSRLISLNSANMTICFNLNGCTVTKTGDSANAIMRTHGAGSVLNVMDNSTAGTLIGKAGNTATRGAVIEVRTGTCNIYGGNIRVAADATPEAITVAGTSGNGLNIYGGTFEGGIKVNGSAALTLSGAPVITKLSNYTGATLCHSGKNLCDANAFLPNVVTYDETTGLWTSLDNKKGYHQSLFTGQVSVSGDRDVTKLINVTPNTTYTIRINDWSITALDDFTMSENHSGVLIGMHSVDGKYITGLHLGGTSAFVDGGVTLTFTTTSICHYLDIRRYNTKALVSFSSIQVEIGNTYTGYEPYCGAKYTVDFGKSVIGEYDWTKGILTDVYGNKTQLTPQEILALPGTNILHSDAGDTIVTGKADPVVEMEKLKNAILALGGNV